MTFEDTVNNRQPETDSISLLLGREERFENMGQFFRRDSSSRIRDQDDCVPGFITVHNEPEAPTAFHRFHGVDEQREKRLLNLISVAQDGCVRGEHFLLK